MFVETWIKPLLIINFCHRHCAAQISVSFYSKTSYLSYNTYTQNDQLSSNVNQNHCDKKKDISVIRLFKDIFYPVVVSDREPQRSLNSRLYFCYGILSDTHWQQQTNMITFGYWVVIQFYNFKQFRTDQHWRAWFLYMTLN